MATNLSKSLPRKKRKFLNHAFQDNGFLCKKKENQKMRVQSSVFFKKKHQPHTNILTTQIEDYRYDLCRQK